MTLRLITIAVASCCSLFAHGQTIAPLWKDFELAKRNGTIPLLPDFSYAGYHFSEQPIPNVSGRKYFDVTRFGAIPNDDKYDDEGIQAAILAAEKNPGGGVIFFPRGRFLISPDEDKQKFIRISRSNIVLKGSGAGQGGTEIFQDKMRVGTKQFQFKPDAVKSQKLATITHNASRESFWIEVADPSALKEGQDVVIRHKSEAFTQLYFAPLTLKPDWTRLFGDDGGMNIMEVHTIESIEGKKVKLKNPIHFDLTLVPVKTFDLYSFISLEECGIEDILFTSNWKNYPEEFVHHKDGIHDGGWDAVSMEYIKNGWIRNCEFRDINECIFLRAGYGFTIIDVTFSGKKGHTSAHARAGYGVLIKNCDFNGSHHHGPGTGYSGVGTVVTQCSLNTDQNIDSHSGQPYATLFDDVDGGVFSNLGGPLPGHPHHGKHLVMWNFRHNSDKDFHYNFWDLHRRRNFTIAQPILVGFQSDKKITFENEGINQLQGIMAEPRSLFEAQLNLRLKYKVNTAER